MKWFLKQKPFIWLLVGLVLFISGIVLIPLSQSCKVNTCGQDYTSASGIQVIDATPHVNLTIIRIADVALWVGTIAIVASIIILLYRRLQSAKGVRS